MSYRNRRCLLTHVNPNVRRGLLHVMASVKDTKNGNYSEKIVTKEIEKIDKKTSLLENLPNVENNLEHKRCLRCGRKLKNSEHRLLGYGPVCYEKIKTQTIKRLF